mmetsp:Transcript_61150/g.157696  ORF Transcript_61150/g.157696 Transcript_61150/m.157696 type:complete len:202 (+) Transcript_61150:200-805(+)
MPVRGATVLKASSSSPPSRASSVKPSRLGLLHIHVVSVCLGGDIRVLCNPLMHPHVLSTPLGGISLEALCKNMLVRDLDWTRSAKARAAAWRRMWLWAPATRPARRVGVLWVQASLVQRLPTTPGQLPHQRAPGAQRSLRHIRTLAERNSRLGPAPQVLPLCAEVVAGNRQKHALVLGELLHTLAGRDAARGLVCGLCRLR